MTYQEVLAAARECVGPYCKACPVCNGRACGNAMPGPGCKYPGLTASRNFDKWQEICVNMDTLCTNVEPDISFERPKQLRLSLQPQKSRPKQQSRARRK